MRHGKSNRKFGRESHKRRAMFRSLATSLLEHDRIETTVAKAKDLRRVAERLITLAGNDNVANRRQAYGYLYSKPVVHKLFAEIGPRFKDRPGGYTRIIRSRRRAGDATEMAVIELVSEEFKPSAKKKSKKAAAPKKEAKAQEAPAEEETAAVEAAAEEAPAEQEAAAPAAEETAVEEQKSEATEEKAEEAEKKEE